MAINAASEIAKANIDILAQALKNTKEDLEVRAAVAFCLSITDELVRKYYTDIVNLLLEEKPDDYVGTPDQSIGRSLATLPLSAQAH